MSFDLLSFTMDATETSLRILSITGEDDRCRSLFALAATEECDHTAFSFDLFWLGHLLEP